MIKKRSKPAKHSPPDRSISMEIGRAGKHAKRNALGCSFRLRKFNRCMRVPLLTISFCLGVMGIASAQSIQNMELFGNLDTHRDTAVVNPYRYSACWGYVAADGHEYALLGCPLGTQVVDLEGPSLIERAFIPGPRNRWREMKMYTHYAFIVSEATDVAAGAGLQIVDLQYLPDSVHLIKTYVWTDTVARPSAHTISQNGHFLYLNGGTFNGLRILDISDPENPVKAGMYSGFYVHDTHIRNDTAFASCLANGLDVVNVVDKSSPSRITLLQYSGAHTHNSWTSRDGARVFTTDENPIGEKSMKEWDLADIQNPFLRSTTGTNLGLPIVHNVVVKGSLAYVAWYTAGLRVFDVNTPSSPVQVGYFDSYPQDDSVIFNGNWGVDPFLPSGKAIVSDMSTGLHVVRCVDDRRGVVTGTVRDAATNQPIPGVLLHFQGQPSLTRWTGSNGSYIFGFAPGPQTAHVEKTGYLPKTVEVSVPDTGTTSFDFVITPITTGAGERADLPRSFALDQNFPNPFNPTTKITIASPVRTEATLRVYNVLGQVVATLFDGTTEAGERTLSFDAAGLPSGVYFSVLRTPAYAASRKMVVSK
ncbi:MAG: hypothetical protein A3G43_08165 [Ignavibacteria bacterium RIFCSPLOWO2_12_FULL_56_21]|nr:MAG: hypothetical protein A3G43_08165 [Ignavibacteria bacterium RIFCSPLOWO2_12_FULL_56_21]